MTSDLLGWGGSGLKLSILYFFYKPALLLMAIRKSADSKKKCDCIDVHEKTVPMLD